MSRLHRWFGRFIRTVLWVFVIFHLGAGWYFATLVKSDALQIKEWVDPVYTVVAIGPDWIALDAGDADTQDLLRDDRLGVDLGDGYGRIGPVLEVEGTVATRSYEHLIGTEPAAGMTATLHGSAYPAVSGVGDLPAWAEVVYETEFGTFPSWLVDRGSETWAITVHGRGAERDEALRMLPSLDAAGLTTLMISYRNDDDAPWTESRLARFGVSEWEDLEGAVQFALDNGARSVVLVGFSMGGAISMAFLERSPLAEHVSAVILEAPAADLGWMVRSRASETDVIPGVPWKVPVTLFVAAKAWADVLYDVDWWLIDYESRPGMIRVPTLIIHGDADDTVPVGISESIAAQLGSLVTLEVFPGADHVRAWNVDPERYDAVVTEFLVDR